MSRGFLVGGGGSKKSGGNSGKKNAASLLAARGMSREEMLRGANKVEKKDYQDMLDDLLDEKMMSSNPNKYSFSMHGTPPQEEREMSKGMKVAMELMMQKRLKKRAKIKGQAVEIVPKSYGMGADGGRVDSAGRIMNNAGQILLRIDPKTGIISDNMGMKVGKYNPNSMVSDTKIQNLIKKYTQKTSTFNPFAPKN